MDLVIDLLGGVQCLYGEAIDLATLGPAVIARASHVEPDQSGSWYADMSPVAGPWLGPFAMRSAALAAEADWLTNHRLLR